MEISAFHVTEQYICHVIFYFSFLTNPQNKQCLRGLSP